MQLTIGRLQVRIWHGVGVAATKHDINNIYLILSSFSRLIPDSNCTFFFFAIGLGRRGANDTRSFAPLLFRPLSIEDGLFTS